MPTEADYRRAAARIADCERDLKRRLSHGEQRDLIADNINWPMDYIALIVKGLNRGHGIGAFQMGRQRDLKEPEFMSIIEMEDHARIHQVDGASITARHLQVFHVSRGTYTYYWNKQYISRETAAGILASTEQ